MTRCHGGSVACRTTSPGSIPTVFPVREARRPPGPPAAQVPQERSRTMAGFIIAIVAGWLVHDARRAAATVVIPWLGVLGVGAWLLAAGRDDSPPSTVTHFPQAIGFWTVQIVSLALALGIAAMLGSLRARQDVSRGRAGRAGRQAVLATAILVT